MHPNASPSNRAREVFFNKVKPQLDFNNGALRKLLAKDAQELPDGSVRYKVDIRRFNDFFTALSCGIIFKSCGASLPSNFEVNHLYPNLAPNEDNNENSYIEQEIEKFYTGKPMAFLEFGRPSTNNERIYTVEVFGIPKFESSITIVHLFFGKFKVISMLTKK